MKLLSQPLPTARLPEFPEAIIKPHFVDARGDVIAFFRPGIKFSTKLGLQMIDHLREITGFQFEPLSRELFDRLTFEPKRHHPRTFCALSPGGSFCYRNGFTYPYVQPDCFGPHVHVALFLGHKNLEPTRK